MLNAIILLLLTSHLGFGQAQNIDYNIPVKVELQYQVPREGKTVDKVELVVSFKSKETGIQDISPIRLAIQSPVEKTTNLSVAELPRSGKKSGSIKIGISSIEKEKVNFEIPVWRFRTHTMGAKIFVTFRNSGFVDWVKNKGTHSTETFTAYSISDLAEAILISNNAESFYIPCAQYWNFRTRLARDTFGNFDFVDSGYRALYGDFYFTFSHPQMEGIIGTGPYRSIRVTD
jgi:hypothetical protein